MDLEKFEKVWFDFDKNDEVIWNGITVIEPNNQLFVRNKDAKK